MERGRLYMQIQIPNAFPLTLPLCFARRRKLCVSYLLFYLFIYLSSVLPWLSLYFLYSYISCSFTFLWVHLWLPFSLPFVYFALNFLQSPSIFLFLDLNIRMEESYFSPSISTSFLLLLQYSYFPFPNFTVSFLSICCYLSFSILPCPFLSVLYFSSEGETRRRPWTFS